MIWDLWSDHHHLLGKNVLLFFEGGFWCLDYSIEKIRESNRGSLKAIQKSRHHVFQRAFPEVFFIVHSLWVPPHQAKRTVQGLDSTADRCPLSGSRAMTFEAQGGHAMFNNFDAGEAER